MLTLTSPLLLLLLLLLPFLDDGAWQNAQPLHWQRPQCCAALFSLQKAAQPSTLRSPARPELQAAGGGGGGAILRPPLAQKAHALHWQRVQCAPALLSLQKLAQLSNFKSPGKPELQAGPAASLLADSPTSRVSSARDAAQRVPLRCMARLWSVWLPDGRLAKRRAARRLLFVHRGMQAAILFWSGGLAAVAPPVRSVAPPIRASAPLQASWSAPFGPRIAGATAFAMNEPYEAWPALNDDAFAAAVGVARRKRLMVPESGEPQPLDALLEGTDLKARLGRSLARRRAVDRKEFFETWEFFARARTVRTSPGNGTLVDVAGGHGLLAALFAVFEPKRFSRVVVADTRRPRAFDAVLDSMAEVAPWAVDTLEYIDGPAADIRDTGAGLLPAGCAVACVHGCGSLTDAVIEAAAHAEAASVAVMPCCYGGLARDSPRALRRSLGVALAADIERTTTLEALGYRVDWRALPQAITPLNRVLLAKRAKR